MFITITEVYTVTVDPNGHRYKEDRTHLRTVRINSIDEVCGNIITLMNRDTFRFSSAHHTHKEIVKMMQGDCND